MMRLLLVDDEPLALRGLIHALRDVAGIEIVGTANDGVSAMAEALRLSPDLLILDVEMPGLNGIAVAAALGGGDGPDIIILSAFDGYAVDAFVVEAVDYLLKPLRPDRLRGAIDRARRRRGERAASRALSDATELQETASLHIPDRKGGQDLPLADIVWIEACRDYAIVHTGSRSHMMRITMAELASQLPSSVPRVHRSAFVTLSHVRRWAPPSKGVHGLVLSDDTHIQVGPSYVADVRVALRSLQRGRPQPD